jgi:hypothetical protein
LDFSAKITPRKVVLKTFFYSILLWTPSPFKPRLIVLPQQNPLKKSGLYVILILIEFFNRIYSISEISILWEGIQLNLQIVIMIKKMKIQRFFKYLIEFPVKKLTPYRCKRFRQNKRGMKILRWWSAGNENEEEAISVIWSRKA